jgi:hypothetical protein
MCSKPWCCGNERKLGKKTLQEKRAEIIDKDIPEPDPIIIQRSLEAAKDEILERIK